jgi:PTS system N-acetylglucosamine-specific IIC component
MPAAALLARLGAADVLDLPVVAAAGTEIFNWLPMLFAVGVAIGMSKDQRGEAALAAVVAHIVLVRSMVTFLTDVLGHPASQPMIEQLPQNVLLGIVAGLLASWSYNRFSAVVLPQALGFFSGRRLVPIVVAVFSVVVGAALGIVWQPVWTGLAAVNGSIVELGPAGAGLHAFLNRLLLPLGLHHVLNSYLWFGVGEYTAANGAVVTGDIPRFLAGDPSAGTFQVGFYPIMMGGLIGAAGAMIVTAAPQKRRRAFGLLGGTALVSFVTGMTEPLEFAFMFLAPVLYGLHAVLTGVSAWLTNAMAIRHGFGFSAGFIDYVLNFGLASKPIALAGLMVIFGTLYFGVFYAAIRWFDLKTPGRELDDVAADADQEMATDTPVADKFGSQARRLIRALGGASNVIAVDHCATRLRLTVADSTLVDDSAVKASGAMGIVKPSKRAVQVIVGVDSQFVADRMKELLACEGRDNAAASSTPMAAAETFPSTRDTIPIAEVDVGLVERTRALLGALGGASNIQTVQAVAATRLRVVLHDRRLADEAALLAAGAQAIMELPNATHILLGLGVEHYAAELERQLGEART